MKPLALAAQPQRLFSVSLPLILSLSLFLFQCVRDADAGADADAEGFAATARKIAGAHVFRV